MAVKLVSYYMAEPYRPTYYALLYNGQYSRTERPTRPFQIFRADTWPEAKNFAAAFVSKATGQWMGVSSLSPKRADKPTLEVAHVDYWREDDQVYYEESRLPAEVVKSMSETISHEPIAREGEDSELSKRMKEVIRLMKSAKPSQALTKERMEHLKEHGDFSPEQESLVKVTPQEAAKTRPKGETFLDEFKEAHEKEPTLSDPRGYFPFRNWVKNHKLPEADSILLDQALEDAKTEGKDLTYEEAKAKVEEATSKPWSTISAAIDWQRIVLEKEAQQQAAEVVKAAIEAGIIQPKDIGLYRRDIQGMDPKERKAYQNQIAELERQLAEARRPPPSPYGTGKPAIRTPPLNYTEDQVALLYTYFQNQIQRSLKRDPSAPELNRFDEFINRIQRVRPPIRFALLKGQVEQVALAIAALAKGANIPKKRESQRLAELLEKMLRQSLTPEEEDEVSRLEGRIGEEEYLPLGLQQPSFPRPHIRIIAEDGPKQYMLGRSITPGQDYPRELARLWEEDIAKQNADNYRKRGYTVRIEEF